MLARMQRKRISFVLLVGMQAGAATLENSMEVPQKIKNRTTLQSSNCTTRHLYKRYENAVLNEHMHPNVYSSIIDNKVWKYIYMNITMEYYLTIRKNEILPFATTWMELKGIMLSEISQRKIPYVFTHM